MNVGVWVYVDGYNLYDSHRGPVGASGAPGWKCLDLRRLAQAVHAAQSGWAALRLTVSSTARPGSARPPTTAAPSGSQDQDVCLRALTAAAAVDVVELGTYLIRVATKPLADRDRKRPPVLVRPAWPVIVQDHDGAALPDLT